MSGVSTEVKKTHLVKWSMPRIMENKYNDIVIKL